MLSKQEEEQERRATLENDRKVREQQRASTFHQHAQAQADEINQGRFRATGVPSVTGATPVPSYPAAGAHQADPVGTEPPLGFSVSDLEPSAGLSAAEQLGGNSPAKICRRSWSRLPRKRRRSSHNKRSGMQGPA
jgi:hypothetical protein